MLNLEQHLVFRGIVTNFNSLGLKVMFLVFGGKSKFFLVPQFVRVFDYPVSLSTLISAYQLMQQETQR